MEQFYPNECYICKVTEPLKRCSRCNMIAYCSQEHQKKHFPIHKEICKIIATLMKDNKVSHIFQDLKGVDSKTWNQKRQEVLRHVKTLIGRPLHKNERQLIIFPRVCYVCYETRHSVLKNCPNCTCASFCNKHPSSFHHDKLCSSIQACHKLDVKINADTYYDVVAAVTATVNGTRVPDSLKLPTSTKDFLEKFIDTKDEIPEDIMFLTSEYWSKPLTIFNGIQQLNISVSSKMVFAVAGADFSEHGIKSWELLLHLFQNLIVLKVVVLYQEESQEVQGKLCAKCRFKKKKLIVRSSAGGYQTYRKEETDQKPNIVAFFNGEHPENDGDSYINWAMKMSEWSKIPCPLVFTTVTEKKGRLLSESLLSSFWSSLICYEGINNFGSLRPWREWTDGGTCSQDKYVIVTKEQGSFLEPTMFSGGPKINEKKLQRMRRDLVEKTYLEIVALNKEKAGSADSASSMYDMLLEVENSKSWDSESSLKETPTKSKEGPKTASESKKPESKESTFKGKAKSKNKLEAGNVKSRKEPEREKKETESIVVKDELQMENLSLYENNRFLEENLILKKRNQQLKNEYFKIQEENKRLKEENRRIKGVEERHCAEKGKK